MYSVNSSQTALYFKTKLILLYHSIFRCGVNLCYFESHEYLFLNIGTSQTLSLREIFTCITGLQPVRNSLVTDDDFLCLHLVGVVQRVLSNGKQFLTKRNICIVDDPEQHITHFHHRKNLCKFIQSNIKYREQICTNSATDFNKMLSFILTKRNYQKTNRKGIA